VFVTVVLASTPRPEAAPLSALPVSALTPETLWTAVLTAFPEDAFAAEAVSLAIACVVAATEPLAESDEPLAASDEPLPAVAPPLTAAAGPPREAAVWVRLAVVDASWLPVIGGISEASWLWAADTPEIAPTLAAAAGSVVATAAEVLSAAAPLEETAGPLTLVAGPVTMTLAATFTGPMVAAEAEPEFAPLASSTVPIDPEVVLLPDCPVALAAPELSVACPVSLTVVLLMPRVPFTVVAAVPTPSLVTAPETPVALSPLTDWTF
jgi:hypothetical protein